MKKVIIDTDPGIDDAAAIFLALASPELSVEALTTIYGNGPVESCTDNALRLLHAAHRRDIPVYPGVGKPLLREPTSGWASAVHGADALGDIGFPLPPDYNELRNRRHAVPEIIDRIMAAPGEITFLALGRMTNIALALSIEPRLAQAVAEVIVMGGAVAAPGNVSPVATANLYEDPEAAAILYASGAPLVQVGMDVCDQVNFSLEQVEQVGRADTPTTRLLAAATPYLQASYRSRGLLNEQQGIRYNDVPSVAYAIDPGLFGQEDLYVTIETQSSTSRGQTLADRRRSTGQAPNARVCLEVDAPRLTALFTDRVVNYSGG
ncbi:MAG: nucleoside hydrolase [Dehalococcoidia bacterium]